MKVVASIITILEMIQHEIWDYESQWATFGQWYKQCIEDMKKLSWKEDDLISTKK